MAEEIVVRVEGSPETDSIEEIEEVGEVELWRDALSGVTGQLAELSRSITQDQESRGQQSQELRTVLETQAELIRSLMQGKAESDRVLLETVQRLLTPPPPVVVVEPEPETLTETPPVVDPAALVVPVEPERIKRFRGI